MGNTSLEVVELGENPCPPPYSQCAGSGSFPVLAQQVLNPQSLLKLLLHISIPDPQGTPAPSPRPPGASQHAEAKG